MIIWFTEVNFLFLPQSQLAGGLEGAFLLVIKKTFTKRFFYVSILANLKPT